jgi:hypothetical protein
LVFHYLVDVVNIAGIGRGMASWVEALLITDEQHEFLQRGWITP